MGQERDSNHKIGIPQERQGQVRSWGEMSHLLTPLDLDKPSLKIARSYFNAQKFLAEGKKRRASRRFESLSKITGYDKFEDENPNLFGIIDIAVSGKSNRSEY